jgi:hypothetical protein
MALRSNILILPIALEPVIPPGRISHIRTMPLYENPAGWLQRLSTHLEQKKVEKERRQEIWSVAAVIGGLWLLDELSKE